jgi:hypothetical protein
MVRVSWRHLFVLLLLGIALGWPLLGSAPSVAGERPPAIAAGETDGCPDCDGCVGGSGDGQTCPTTLCAVVPAVVPVFALEGPTIRSVRPGFAQERGLGLVPDVQPPPPRPTLLA